MPEKLIFDPQTGELVWAPDRVKYEQNRPPVTRSVVHSLQKAKYERSGQLLPELQAILPSIRTRLSKDPSQCREVLEVLRLATPEYAPVLDPLLQLVPTLMANASTFALLLEVCARIGWHPSALATAMELLQSPDSAVRIATLQIIGSCGRSARSLSLRVLQLFQDPMGSVREAVWSTLKLTDFDHRAAPEITALIRHRDTATRHRMLDFLMECREGVFLVMPALVMRLDDSDSAIRSRAESLIRQTGFVPISTGEWVRMLNHTKPERRQTVLEILKDFGDYARVLSPDILSLLADPSASIRLLAWNVLESVGLVPQCLRALDGLRYHPEWQVRRSVVDVLTRFPQVRSLASGIAVALLSDREFAVREAAQALLKTMDLTADAILEIQKCLLQGNREIQLSLLLILSEKGASVRFAAPVILSRLETAHHEQMLACCMAIRSIGINTECLPMLDRMLRQGRQDRRLLILELLKDLGEHAVDALPLVIGRLGDDDRIVRDLAVETLVQIGFQESALPAVKRVIEHQNREFRLAVIQALGSCGLSATSATAFINARMNDSDAEVGRAARKALDQIAQWRQTS
jgi:HEAT repeat protein